MEVQILPWEEAIVFLGGKGNAVARVIYRETMASAIQMQLN